MHVIVALVRENQRDIGLVRAVGPWAFAASIVSMIVGAGIFAVPATLAACVGPYAPLAFLACGFPVGASAIHSSTFVLTVQPDAQGFGRALILAVFALVGMETSLCASGEVVQPNRTIPRALTIAILSTTILYVAIQVIAQGILGSSLATSKAPLADAMAHIHPALRAVMLAGTALSMFGWLGSDILGSPRQLFAFARDGLLPRVLGRLHPRSHAPYVAILCY